ncbi:MAG: PAS domain S-box protein, partial [Coriobacteriales bacterium]|nr:PAS domain S-box protein [Coriobacteriales bacterium]
MADTGNNELTTLQREVRRLQRELDKCNVQITRIQNNNQAKAQFAEIVLAERSRLERNMNLMLANSRDFVLFFDVDGDLIFVTDSFVRAIGAQSPGMVKGKNAFTLMAELMPREVTLQVKKYSDAIFAGAELPPLELQTQADLDKSGQLRDYHINISKMSNEAGEHEGWLCIFYDVSDLVQAKRDAEQANQAKSDFLATVSHEIRTPMNAIVGLTRMMEVTPLSDQQRGYLNKMKISSNTLLDLINGILDF